MTRHWCENQQATLSSTLIFYFSIMPSTKYSKIALDSDTDGEDQLASYTSNTTKNRTVFRALISLCVFFAFIAAVLAGLLYTRGTVCIDKGLATELGTSPLVIVKIGGA